MIGLKKYVCMTVLMLCFVSFSTSLLGGNCCSCCGVVGKRLPHDDVSLPVVEPIISREDSASATTAQQHEEELGVNIPDTFEVSESDGAVPPAHQELIPPAFCSLCLTSYTSTDTEVFSGIFCERCLSLYTAKRDDIRETHPLVEYERRAAPSTESQRDPEVPPSTPPRLVSESSIGCYFSPQVRLVQDSIYAVYAGQWVPVITREGVLQRLMETQKILCSPQFLLDLLEEEIGHARVELASNVAQVYMAGMFYIGTRRGRVGRELNVQQLGAVEDPTLRYDSVITDMMIRAFKTRIRILTGEFDAIDPTLWLIWQNNAIPDTVDEEEYKNKLLYESALGWPCFEEQEQAERYNRWMPRGMFEVRSIRDSEGRIVCWLVAPQIRE